MALDDLIRTLTREAEAEAAGILESARTEAAAIRVAAESAVDALRSARSATREEARASGVAVAVTAARRQARSEVLTARRQLIDRVLAGARALLPAALQRPEYRATLDRDVATALTCIGGRPASFRCHDTVAAPVRRMVREHPGVRVLTDAAIGAGFRAATDDGSLEIDATLEARLAGQETGLAQEVVRRETSADALG